MLSTLANGKVWKDPPTPNTCFDLFSLKSFNWWVFLKSVNVYRAVIKGWTCTNISVLWTDTINNNHLSKMLWSLCEVYITTSTASYLKLWKEKESTMQREHQEFPWCYLQNKTKLNIVPVVCRLPACMLLSSHAVRKETHCLLINRRLWVLGVGKDKREPQMTGSILLQIVTQPPCHMTW